MPDEVQIPKTFSDVFSPVRGEMQCVVCGIPIGKCDTEGQFFTVRNRRVFLCSEDAVAFVMGRQVGQGELHDKVVSFLTALSDDATGYILKQRIYTIVPEARRLAMEKQRLSAIKPYCPREMYATLDKIVVGQDRAKRDVSLAVYEHGKAAERDIPLVPDKHHVLLLGESGSGKTLIAETIARSLSVPFVSADATGFSPTGFHGHDVDTVVHDLLTKASGIVQTAERGIVLMDELDKIALHSDGSNREHMYAATQASMLRLVEGKEVKVPGYLIGDTIADPPVVVNTAKLLFFFGGAFTGLADILATKMGHKKHYIGLRKPDATSSAALEHANRTYDILAAAPPEIMVDALIEYGLTTELVGRIPAVTPLAPLTPFELRRCLLELDHSPVVRQQALFRESNYMLEFAEELSKEIVRRAHTMATGTRALKYLVKRSVSHAAFDLLGLQSHSPGSTRVIITLECLQNPAAYEIVKSRGGRQGKDKTGTIQGSSFLTAGLTIGA